VGRWQTYWFSQGGRLAAAIVRVALALAMLVTLWNLGADQLDRTAPSFYRPLEPWLSLGAPPAGALAALRVIAWAATAAMLLGLFSRASTAISLAAALALASYEISATGRWAAHDSLPFLAQLAFLGARGGDALSLDAWTRRLRGRTPLVVRDGYQWSLRLVQIAVALVFVSAAWAKLWDGESFRFALGDSLRQQLALHAEHATSAARWIAADPSRIEAVALLDFIAELLPLGAVLFVRRPWLRLGFGSFFLIQTVAHGVVLDAWNLAWLPLIAVFVDWDRLVDWTADRVVRERAPSPPQMPYHHRVATAFIAVFLTADLALSFFYPQLDPAYRAGVPSVGDAVATDQAVEHLPRDAGHPGGPGHDAASLVEPRADVVALEGVDRPPPGRVVALGRRRLEVAELAEHHQPLEGVAQLADVARPAVGGQGAAHRR
jgi:hypothetical protein